MSYKHGIYIYEEPTNIVPPVRVDSAMPVFFVTAPLHLSKNPYSNTNEPRLIYNYKEAVQEFGFSLNRNIFSKYTACEVIYSQFVLYACAPIVIVNVLDPDIHNEKIIDEAHSLAGQNNYLLNIDGVLIDSVIIKESGGTVFEAGTHYSLAFDKDGYINISFNKGFFNGSEQLLISYTKLAPEKVNIYDIIDGYDNLTDKYTGLELLNYIYPNFWLVPGQLVVPKFSSDPAVAAVMETKAANINGHFRCIALNDLPSDMRYQEIPAWTKENNYTSTRQYNCYPKIKLGEMIFDLSVQIAGLICKTDSLNYSVPYNSPSNKKIQSNGICKENGEEMLIGVEQANYLNSQGIVTAINWINGFVAWGNRTGCYPSNTDVKDSFIPIRRMFDWIANTIVLTYWSKIDGPITRRMIDTIIDSINIWFNGLAAREFILGGRVEFLESDNETVDLMDGIVKFKVSITPPSPMEEVQFILQYDPEYLQRLFTVS